MVHLLPVSLGFDIYLFFLSINMFTYNWQEDFNLRPRTMEKQHYNKQNYEI
jgi:hypothetical protein